MVPSRPLIHGWREEQPRVLGAEVVQIEIQRVFDERGHTPAAILVIAALQLGFLFRREIDRQLVFFAHFLLLSGVRPLCKACDFAPFGDS